MTPVVTAADKIYDGTTTATLTSCTVTGELEGDVVACAGTATFDSATVGTDKTVTVSGDADGRGGRQLRAVLADRHADRVDLPTYWPPLQQEKQHADQMTPTV